MKRSLTVLLLAVVLIPVSDGWAIRPHPWRSSEPAIFITPRLGFVAFTDGFENFTGFNQVSDGIIGLDLSFPVVNGLGVGFEIADVGWKGEYAGLVDSPLSGNRHQCIEKQPAL